MHGRETRLGAVAYHYENKADTDYAGVELGGDLHHRKPTHRACLTHDLGGSGIDDYSAKQAEGNAYGRHNNIFPCRLQAMMMTVVANQDG